jgi:adenine-specific DNA-methyltransferase
MAKSNTRLELTWIGKENRPKLEPRILVEDPEKSYHATQRVTDNDIFDNRLIFGDNLLALKALEQEFGGRIKCIYIDPPFNTGSAFEHYDDGVEHSLWLALMRDRFESLRRLMTNDGLFFLHLDDGEMAYAKVLLDEVFGRFNYCNTICMTTNDPSGFKATGATVFSTANYLLVYAKDKSTAPMRKVFIEKSYDTAYSKVLADRAASYDRWSWEGINDVVARELGFDSVRTAKREVGDAFEDEVARFAVTNAERVFQTAAIGGGAAIKRAATIRQSMQERQRVFVHPGEDVPDFYILNGRQILFYDKRLIEIDGRRIPGEIVTDVWTDISWNGISNEGSVEFKNGKKPELLIKRVLDMATGPGDIVLDSFAGSGTTGAVAHKMGRRWIMIELGEHCHTHIIPRMKRVISGEDQGGISKAVDWKGGGGFRYYKLGPSLIVKDEWENPVINPEFNAAMLAEAMCKLEGFTFDPNADIYWQQGRSSETDFIYVTTQMMTKEMLTKLSDEVGPNRSLLICCGAFRCDVSQFENLTVKKIPKAVLKKCEWGHDDYSLEICNLPRPPQPAVAAEKAGVPEPPKRPTRKFGKGKDTGPTLFDMDAINSTGGK